MSDFNGWKNRAWERRFDPRYLPKVKAQNPQALAVTPVTNRVSQARVGRRQWRITRYRSPINDRFDHGILARIFAMEQRSTAKG